MLKNSAWLLSGFGTSTKYVSPLYFPMFSKMKPTKAGFIAVNCFQNLYEQPKKGSKKNIGNQIKTSKFINIF